MLYSPLIEYSNALKGSSSRDSGVPASWGQWKPGVQCRDELVPEQLSRKFCEERRKLEPVEASDIVPERI